MITLLSFFGISLIISFFAIIVSSTIIKIDDFKYYYSIYKSLKYMRFVKSKDPDPIWIEYTSDLTNGFQILSDGSFRLNADHWLCKNWTLYFSPYSWYWHYKYTWYFKQKNIQ